MAKSIRLPQRGPSARQNGATLVIALIFLIVLTLLVFSGVNTGTLSYRIAANMQLQHEAAAAAQAAIDSRLGDPNCLSSPATCAGSPQTIGIFTVTVDTPKCFGIDSQQASGKKNDTTVAPTPTYLWEISATANNAASGASATVVQGVKVEMNIGSNCPN